MDWNDVEKLVLRCIQRMPGRGSWETDTFFCDTDVPDEHGFVFKEKSGSTVAKASILKNDDENETQIVLAVSDGTKRKNYTLIHRHIYEEPAIFGAVYPDFHYYWKEEPHAGALTFFRVDINLHAFVSYKSENGFAAEKHGDQALLREFPDRLSADSAILNHPVPLEINFREKAREIVALSGLAAFTEECERVLEEKVLH